MVLEMMLSFISRISFSCSWRQEGGEWDDGLKSQIWPGTNESGAKKSLEACVPFLWLGVSFIVSVTDETQTLFQRWSLLSSCLLFPTNTQLGKIASTEARLNSQIYCKTTWGVVKMSFTAELLPLKREKKKIKHKPAPNGWSISCRW